MDFIYSFIIHEFNSIYHLKTISVFNLEYLPSHSIKLKTNNNLLRRTRDFVFMLIIVILYRVKNVKSN